MWVNNHTANHTHKSYPESYPRIIPPRQTSRTACGISPGRTWPPRAEAVPVTRRLFESIGSAPKLYHAFVHHLFIARPPTHSRWILELKVYRKPQRSQKTSWTGWRLLATVGSAVSYGHTVIHFHCNRSRRSLVMLGIMWQGSTESIAQLTQ